MNHIRQTMVASPTRVYALAFVAGVVCIISFVLSSTKLSSHRQQQNNLRRHLSMGAFNDPKTVELRPVVNDNDYAKSDINIMNLIGAPTSSQRKGHEVVYKPQQAGASEAVGNTQTMGAGNTIADTSIQSSQQNQIINNNELAKTTNGETFPDRTVQPYNIDNALSSIQAFRYTIFFFIYDSANDEFVVVHNIPKCDHGCHRIYRVASVIALALRKNDPSRFTKHSSEATDLAFLHTMYQGMQRKDDPSRFTKHSSVATDLVFMLSCGDAPRVKIECLRGNYCNSVDFAPILQFGSVFVDETYFPSMIPMPMPVRPHIPCFDEWQVTGFGHSGVCQDLQPTTDFSSSAIRGGLVFGQELGLLTSDDYWDKLIPQIIWRGTDFVFLHTMYQGMRAPQYQMDIAPKERELEPNPFANEYEKKAWGINTLWEMGDEQLLPRWRGVLLTSEAELEASTSEQTTLPWINVKFANINVGGVKQSASENAEYQMLAKYGISAIGERVNMTEQAKYKYHVDLGGGGGTTWTGTIEKLSLPGLLFHHVTPTKDYFHDLLVPWEHYVPIKADLSDLREKYEWAESHPIEAKQIAENGTRFARWMGSVDGFGQMYQEFIVNPLRNVVRAYRPMPPRYKGKSVLDVVLESGQGKYAVVARCSGLHANSCDKLG